MSSIPHYSRAQRLALSIGNSLISWAEERAHAHAIRKAAADEKAARLTQQHREADQRREEAILRYLQHPRF